MKERIILAPGVKGSELARSLALHGVNSMGLRICGAAELARMALMRSGIAITEDFVSGKEESAIVAEAVLEEPYFNRASYSGIQEIASVLRRMRCLAVSGDESQELERILPRGIFGEKNAALLHVCQRYLELLTERKSVDGISLIRRASTECSVIDAEFMTLKEFPLNPLEQALLEKISGGNIIESNLPDLFHADRKTIHVSSIRNCYGAPNEVETILTDIYSGKKLDQCTVAVTDVRTYSQLFFDEALLYDIPVTFGCGIPITNSNPASLASVYLKWCTSGFFGKAAVTEMLSGRSFNRKKLFDLLPELPEKNVWSILMELLGNLRLTNDRTINEKRIADLKASGKDRHNQRKLQYIPCLEILAEELSLPAEEFIYRYANIRKGSGTNAEHLIMLLDMAASEAIHEELKVMRSAGQSVEDVLPNILKMSVCRQRSEAGKLHITSIEGALSTIRENLYIAGLSASHYPGSPKENYLLLDADLDLFGTGAENNKSDSIVLRKREQLLSLASLASSLGSCVSVSYSGLNVSELKKENPSSLVYELFREEHGSSADSEELEKHIQNVGYFEPALSASRLVGDAYIKGMTILAGTTDPQEDDLQTESLQTATQKSAPQQNDPQKPTPQQNDLQQNDPQQSAAESGALGRAFDKAWSPTELGAFFACPRRFMLRYLLGIPEPEDYDPFQVMTALDTGLLAHSMMEELGNTSLSREEFLKLSEEAFERFLKSHPPLVAENVPAVREQFLDMMETAYGMDPHREVILEEEDIQCTHESGVRIHGYPDRVEKLEDGSCLIVDFKSGRQVVHEQDDIDTCLQVIIYAYLMEQSGASVSGGEYRYLRLGETVSCRYDDEMKRSLSERLETFQRCMRDGSFPTVQESEDGTDPCRFCKYGLICGKAAEAGDDAGKTAGDGCGETAGNREAAGGGTGEEGGTE